MPAAMPKWDPAGVLGLPYKPKAGRNFPCLYGQHTPESCSSSPTKAEIAKLEKDFNWLAHQDPADLKSSNLALSAEHALCFCSGHSVMEHIVDLQERWWTKLQDYVASQKTQPAPNGVSQQPIANSSVAEKKTLVALPKINAEDSFYRKAMPYTWPEITLPRTICSSKVLNETELALNVFKSPFTDLLKLDVMPLSKTLRRYLQYDVYWRETLAFATMVTPEYYQAKTLRAQDWIRQLWTDEELKEFGPDGFYRFSFDMCLNTAPVNLPNAGQLDAHEHAERVYEHARAILDCEEERWWS